MTVAARFGSPCVCFRFGPVWLGLSSHAKSDAHPWCDDDDVNDDDDGDDGGDDGDDGDDDDDDDGG